MYDYVNRTFPHRTRVRIVVAGRRTDDERQSQPTPNGDEAMNEGRRRDDGGAAFVDVLRDVFGAAQHTSLQWRP